MNMNNPPIDPIITPTLASVPMVAHHSKHDSIMLELNEHTCVASLRHMLSMAPDDASVVPLSTKDGKSVLLLTVYPDGSQRQGDLIRHIVGVKES